MLNCFSNWLSVVIILTPLYHTHTIHILFVLPIQKCIWTGIKWESERISKWHDSFYILHICKFRPWQILIPFYVQTKQKKIQLYRIHMHFKCTRTLISFIYVMILVKQNQSQNMVTTSTPKQVRKDEMEEKNM